ncbi:MAG: hypothetical protein VKJ46_13680 [Leptolyngbyaceae bacterium]|nr:hypothetical protein [Leptolyngbyaceae bacterium]
MTLPGTVRFPRSIALVSLCFAATSMLGQPAQAQTLSGSKAPSSAPAVYSQAQPVVPSSPDPIRPLAADGSVLSLSGGQRLMTEASSAVSSQNYTLAVKKLQDARQVFNQISNFYQDLAASFSGIDNRIADSQRRKALETAQMRDQATYQLALVHRAQNQPELAVPLLVQIIRSQQPTRELGEKSYQQLFELGFVDAPYSKTGAAQPSTPPK